MHSPFENILYTNAVPTDEQCDDIRTFLASPSKELTDLNDEVARIQALLEETTRKRDELKDFVDAHLALVSPTRRLPDDIVRAVFLETLPTTRNSVLVSDEGPLLVSQICRYWREVALTTPRLWASMHIIIPGDPSRFTRLMEVVASWLNRSGAVPLTVSLQPSRTWTEVCDILPLLTVLIPVSRRWKEMEFTLPPGDETCPLTSLAVEDVPLLLGLKFSTHMPSGGVFPGPKPPFKAFTFAQTSRLTSFEYSGDHQSLPLSLSWGSLRHLKLYLTVDDFNIPITYPSAIFQQCMSLETFEITMNGSVAEVPTHHASLPRLSHLSISSYPSSDGHKLLNFMDLPCLESLDIHTTINTLDTSRLLRLTNPLKSLKLDPLSLSSNDLIEILAAMTSLEQLCLISAPYDPALGPWLPPIYDTFLAHLTPSEYSNGRTPTICPRLLRLELGHHFISDMLLVQFVLSRTSAQALANEVAQLTDLTAHLRHAKELDVAEQLRDVVAAGLRLSLTYIGSAEWKYSPVEGTEMLTDGGGAYYN